LQGWRDNGGDDAEEEFADAAGAIAVGFVECRNRRAGGLMMRVEFGLVTEGLAL